MIEKAHVVQMARYNAWQNRQIMDIVEAMDEAALRKDRGAFFGSILATLNHLLWADQVWMSRFCEDVSPPGKSIAESVDFTPTPGVWNAERFRMDGRIRIWSETLSNFDLLGDLTWYSGALDAEVVKPRALCVTHMFNHQTHHRGQIHAMLAAAGQGAPVSDLFVMPETF